MTILILIAAIAWAASALATVLGCFLIWHRPVPRPRRNPEANPIIVEYERGGVTTSFFFPNAGISKDGVDVTITALPDRPFECIPYRDADTTRTQPGERKNKENA